MKELNAFQTKHNIDSSHELDISYHLILVEEHNMSARAVQHSSNTFWEVISSDLGEDTGYLDILISLRQMLR
jgi:uncharacterized membrane protein